MKRFVKIISFVFSFVFLLVFFSGCSSNELKKASKNLSSYTIDAVFDDENKVVRATEEISYYNDNGEIMTKLWFHLYPNAFSEESKVKPYTSSSKSRCFPNGENFGNIKINSVSFENLNLDFTYVDENKELLEVLLPKPLEVNKRITIKIDFEVKLSENTHRLGYFENEVNLGNWYPIVCMYENGEFDDDIYYDIGDPFYSSCANYNVKISYPSKYSLASTGEILSENETNGVKTTRLKALAVRDFAMVLGSNYNILTENYLNTEISVYAYRDDESISYYMETAKKAIQYFNDTFGTYPYKRLTVVFTNFLQGGMEYPMLALVSDSISKQSEIAEVIVHEIAHQWWYSVVGNDEVSESYLDEAMAEYSTMLFFDNYSEYSKTRNEIIGDAKKNLMLYEDVVKTTKRELNSKMNLKINEYSSEYEYVYMVYVKGMLMIDEIRNDLGDEVFFNALKHYYNENKFKIANTEKFIKAFEMTGNQEIGEKIYACLDGNFEIN